MKEEKMTKLSDRQWKEFWLSGNDGIFNLKATSSGIDGNKLHPGEGLIPYISRSNNVNGINSFVTSNQASKYKMDDGKCISIGLDTQTVFFQPHKFYTGQNIQVLRRTNLTENKALFFIQSVLAQMNKFNWGGNGATLGRLRRTKIMLPVKDKGDPDYKFMESFVEEIKSKKISEAVNFITQNLRILTYKNIPSLNDKEWKAFKISDLFTIESGCDIYEKNRAEGKTPYITSSASNNGIKYFVSNKNKTIDTNAVSVNRNGSVGYAFYHKYPALYSNDCRKLKLKTSVNFQNEAVYLFATTQIMQQKEKYNYCLKMGTGRLSSQRIMLPINAKGHPDYEYMEQYIKNIMLKKYEEYLNFKA